MSQYLQNLSEAITAMHGCDCSHLSTAKVIEQVEGNIIWNGQVEIFHLSGHNQASKAFAWAWDNEGEPNYIAVLNMPPINDPSDAVKAAIASGSFKWKSKEHSKNILIQISTLPSVLPKQSPSTDTARYASSRVTWITFTGFPEVSAGAVMSFLTLRIKPVRLSRSWGLRGFK